MEVIDFNGLRTQHAAQNVKTTMMDVPLRVTDLIKRAEEIFPNRKIISRKGPNQIEIINYKQLAAQAKSIAAGLKQAGIKAGQRVATLMWSHTEHLACYYAIPAVDAVLHPLNLRLNPEELAYIIADAGDDILIVDKDLIPLLKKIEQFVKIPTVIVNGRHAEYALSLEDLKQCVPLNEWPNGPFDENSAVGICYTSGTTGRPKGVVYSHRSTVLHALSCSLQSGFGFSSNDTLLTLTPLFHVNAWGVPYSGTMLGLNQILPGARITMTEVLDLTLEQDATAILGVPTFWPEILDLLENNPDRWRFKRQLRIHSGGSQATDDMYHRFSALNMTLQNGWGMTECSPIASQTWLQHEHLQLPKAEKFEILTSNGLPIPLVDMRIMGADDSVQPWDGKSTGELQVRSAWITREYLSWENPISASTSDGWLKTGDIATIRTDGYIRIVDRMKDLIKSGGEWISSVDMENHLCNHPSVVEAAVVAIPDEKWGERPLAIVVLHCDDENVDEIKQYLSDFYEKWMLPEAIVPIDEIPKTSIGKIDKKLLRAHYQRYLNQIEPKVLV